MAGQGVNCLAGWRLAQPAGYHNAGAGVGFHGIAGLTDGEDPEFLPISVGVRLGGR